MRDFKALDEHIQSIIPSLDDEQLLKVEVWGELSKQEQDKRFPETYEKWRNEQLEKKVKRKQKPKN